jgi:hypothetical protein
MPLEEKIGGQAYGVDDDGFVHRGERFTAKWPRTPRLGV